ncbi:hypothetical protein BDR07DRAFT_1398025 [Suillus spraguei]|nr:hypothetical protein BDR07DRAFT_1446283 [Suillus spraguei]KAG2365738.1 hypothetical protein BDR07DRAFT_1398025 [Suillus spraguei]
MKKLMRKCLISRTVSWTDTLTWSLVSVVTSDDAIPKGLYPEPGANASTKNGGGAKKTRVL